MNHQYSFPSGLVDQRVGINGQHLGRSHGIGMVEGCWHRTLGPNDAIMEKQWHVTLMLLHIYYEEIGWCIYIYIWIQDPNYIPHAFYKQKDMVVPHGEKQNVMPLSGTNVMPINGTFW